jgi:hypothetical protein
MIVNPLRLLGTYSRIGFVKVFDGSFVKAPFSAAGSEQRN